MDEKISEIYNSENIEELGNIIDIIHDCFFNLDEIHFDQTNQVLRIPFNKDVYEERELLSGIILKKVKIPVKKYFLEIHNVKDYLINDSEQVGDYDFETILYNPEFNTLTIQTNIPLTFKIVVKSLKLVISKGSNIIEEKVINTFFG